MATGLIYGEENVSQAKHFLNEALKYNGNNRYIENYEYAIALLTLGFAHLYLDELDDAKLWLNKGLEFSSTLKDAEILEAYGLCDLGKYYAKTNDFSRAISLLEKALSIVDNNQESWARDTASQICWGLFHAYTDHYINKPEGNKAIVYAQKSFKKFGLENYSYNKIDDIKKAGDSLCGGSYWCLAKAYNRVGEHDNAQKFAHYYYHLHEKYFKNDDHILDKALIDIEYGYTLLRKGELISALNVLSEVITAKQELNDNYYLLHAIISRTETLIRLNKLDKAYIAFQYAIKQKGKSTDNYTKLLFSICLYHAFIIKYKQKDYKLALKHFAGFTSSIKEFCNGF